MKHYTSSYFKLNIFLKTDKVLMTQELNSIVNTKDLPLTDSLLNEHLPSIFENECINDRNLSFREEVKATEIGHLFEHIVLEHLKIETETAGKKADYSGSTSWNWETQKRGIFNIEINLNTVDTKTFNSAFKKSVTLLEKIFLFQNQSRSRIIPAPRA